MKICAYALPVFWVMIFKLKSDLWLLRIPIMYDWALQALFLIAFVPEFEKIFEENSHGFWPERRSNWCYKIMHICCQQAKNLLLDGDIV